MSLAVMVLLKNIAACSFFAVSLASFIAGMSLALFGFLSLGCRWDFVTKCRWQKKTMGLGG